MNEKMAGETIERQREGSVTLPSEALKSSSSVL